MTPRADRFQSLESAEAIATAAMEEVAELGRSYQLSAIELTDTDRQLEAAELLATIWSRSAEKPLAPELFRAFQHTGNYLGGVLADSRLAGAAVAFFDSTGRLHSHIAGVAEGHRGRHAGLLLKLHQRAWALQRGVTEIHWTYDPLVRHNAYFNISKLGALPIRYLPNFYGCLRDGINTAGDSDRFLVRWSLDSSPAAWRSEAGSDLPASLVRSAVPLIEEQSQSRRTLELSVEPRPPAVLVATPPDVMELRAHDPPAALRWRLAVRLAVCQAFDAGFVVRGMTRDGSYVLVDQSN